MGQFDSQDETAPSGVGTDFAGRPPSTSWERISFADSPQNYIWVWFKPANVPQGLIVKIPDETFRNDPHPEQLTMRKLLQAVGVEPSSVSMWYLYGVPYEGQNGTTPFLDSTIPEPVAGVDPDIVVSLNPPQVETMQQPAATATAEAEHLAEVFEHIDADWNAILQIEKQLTRLRKQLVDMSNKIKALNRDLTPLERLHGSNQDKKDWQDARRWLRDAATQLSVCIRDHDIGELSSAGNRKKFAQIYQQFIVPRQQFDGMWQARRDYETYRKRAQTLQNNMNNAHLNAAQNGERRAQRVLKTIAVKIREATTKKNFLGIMLD